MHRVALFYFKDKCLFTKVVWKSDISAAVPKSNLYSHYLIWVFLYFDEELEGLANEQDKETDRIALLKDADNHRKQLTRYYRWIPF